jgi:putative YphP/YqiW family bacilliredoxin
MLNVVSRPPMYDQSAVQHMRDELVAVGFTELLTAKEVEDAVQVKDDKVKLVFINSVCGCAAGSARPAISLALQNEKIPDNIYTVFAGQERDAVDKARSYVKAFPPSSPSIAMFRNGELVFFMQRYDIEGRSSKGNCFRPG